MKIQNILENISSQQRGVGQLPADFRPAQTSPQLNGPYPGRNATRGYLVGEDQDMAEGHADQQRKIFRRNGQPLGEVGIDRESSPGVGQYYMKHYASGTDNSGYDSFEDALAELRHVMKQSIYGELREQGARQGKDISDMEMHKLNVKRFRKDLGLPDRDQPKRDRETDMDIHRYNVERFRRDLGLDKKPGVAEGTDFFDRFGLPIMPDDDGKFQDMICGIKRGTKKQARADRRERDAASRERARAVFGPSPADKLSIRKDQGVAEGFMDTLKGAAREFTRDSLQKKIKQAWENTFWPRHIEPALNRIQIDGQPFRRMVMGEPRVIENDRSKNALLKQYTVNIVFPIDPEQWSGDEIRYLEGQLRDIEDGAWNPKVHGLGLVSFDQPMKSFQYTKGPVPDLVIPVRITSLDINRSLVGEQGVAGGRFDEPLTGWHIVYRKSGNPVHATSSFETKDQAQKYLMTKMFANHQDYKVVHTAGVGVAESGYNPLDDERREQSRMDAERRQFKRDELAAELGDEEQRAQQIMRGTWYIVIDGLVWQRGGRPVTFAGRDAARRAGQTIKNRTPERTVTITTKLPTQSIAELTDMGTAVTAQPTVTPTANNDQQVEVIFFGVPGKDYWARDAWDALEEVLPNEYPRGSERAQLKIAEVQKHGGAVVTVKPLAQAKKLVDTFRGYGIKARINASGINESVIEQERLRIFRESVAAGMTSEDVITTMKRQLGDYLQDVATAIKKDPDLVNKIPKAGDQIGPAVRTIKTDDGHEIRIHGNEDDGFRISIRNRTIPSRFKSLDEAEMATEMYCARRRQATQLRDDYVDEA